VIRAGTHAQLSHRRSQEATPGASWLPSGSHMLAGRTIQPVRPAAGSREGFLFALGLVDHDVAAALLSTVLLVAEHAVFQHS